MGVVAIGPIAKGEVVLSEAPLFTQQLGWNMRTIIQSLVIKTADEKHKFLGQTVTKGNSFFTWASWHQGIGETLI